MRNALYGLSRRAGLAASRFGARVGTAVRNAATTWAKPPASEQTRPNAKRVLRGAVSA